jgi:hypothetical protein
MCAIALKPKHDYGIISSINGRARFRANQGNMTVTHRYSAAGLTTACLGLVLGITILLIPLAPAKAAQQKSAPVQAETLAGKSAKVEDASEPSSTGSLTKAAAEEEPSCNRARRRLWVEGEGWVVRRVTMCR